MKNCPFCGAEIEESARFCLHCMSSLTEKTQIPLHKPKKPQGLLILAAIVAVLLLVVVLMPGTDGQPATPESQVMASPGSAPTQPTSAPATKPSQSTTVPATQPHIHSYSVENTAIEYLKAEATCTEAATYYYSCECGERGS